MYSLIFLFVFYCLLILFHINNNNNNEKINDRHLARKILQYIYRKDRERRENIFILLFSDRERMSVRINEMGEMDENPFMNELTLNDNE